MAEAGAHLESLQAEVTETDGMVCSLCIDIKAQQKLQISLEQQSRSESVKCI